jgi:hypothetical protein
MSTVGDVLKPYVDYIVASVEAVAGGDYTMAPLPNGMSLKTALEAHLDETIAEVEKAYGGCHNCYGKGYATVNDRWIGRDTDSDIGSPGGIVSGGNPNHMKFCSCPRGIQLKMLITELS